MKPLADEAIALAIALVAAVLAFRWLWHLIAPLLPFVLLIGGGIAVYRLFVGRRYF